MPGSIGSVYYDVLPDLAGFVGKVEAGLAGLNPKPIKIKVDADQAGAARSTAVAQRAAAQQTAIAQKAAAQQAAIRARGEVQSRLISQRAAVQATAANARQTASVTRNAERQAAVVARAAARQAAAVERAAAREAAAAERAATRATVAAERASARQAAAATRAAARASAARQSAGEQVGRGATTAGAALALGVGAAVVVNAQFEKSVSAVAATSQEAAGSISVLRGEAIKYGASTAFSATEAANAQAELIKANVSVTDTVNGGLKGALDLASAGSLEVADAASIMATAMSQFNIPGTEASHVADLLAAAAGKAQGEVSDFAGALKYVGPNAKASGVSLEETTGVLAEFANQGILGEQAGTSLRSMLVSLTAPMGAGAKEIKRYGINLRDSKGQFIGLQGAAGELQAKLGALPKAERDAALARIFGKNSLTAATVLYEGGAEAVGKWTAAVNDSGFAQRVAQTKMNNLSGDVEKLGGAFQSAFIGAAQSSTGPLRTVTQAITGAVDAYNGFSDTAKSGGFIGAGLAASALLGVGGFVKVVGVVRSAKSALDAYNISAKRASLAGGAIGLGLAGAAAIIGHFAVQQAEAKDRTDDLTQALLASKGAIDGNIASTRAKSLEDSGALVSAQKLGISIEDLTQASLGNVDAQGRVNDKLASYAEVAGGLSGDLDRTTYGQNGVAEAARKVQEAIGGGNDELNAAVSAYQRQKAAADAAAGSQSAVGDAASENTTALRDAADAAREVGTASSLSASDVKSLTSALFGESDAATAALDATIAYNDAVKAAGDAKGGGLSTKTDKGQANIALLEREAAAIKARAKAMIDSGKPESDVLKYYKDARGELIDHANAMSSDKDQVKNRTDALLETPKELRTQYSIITEQNQQQRLTDLTSKLGALPPEVQTRVQTLIDAGNFSAAADRLDSLAAQREAGIDVTVNGADVAAGNIGEAARDRRAAISVSQRGAGSAGGAIDAAARKRNAVVFARAQGTAKVKGDIGEAARDRRAVVKVGQQGVGAVQGAINGIKGKTVNIKVVTTKSTRIADNDKANGGTLRIPGRLAGGTVPGNGRPKADDVYGIDRSTGALGVMVSSKEEIIRVAQAEKNRAILKQINAGGTWDIVPRRAAGGTVEKVSTTRSSAPAVSSRAERPSQLVAYIDLGPELGGLRRVVADIVGDRDEYAGTLSRMGRN